MALIKCHECGKEISDEAKTCPHCGVKPKTGMGVGKAVLLTFFILIVISMVMGKISSEDAAKQEDARRASLTPAQRAAKDAAKAKSKQIDEARYICQLALEKSLNDPDSAKLESSYKWYAEERKDGTILVQPSGRAKNAFGAYIHGTWNCLTKRDGENIKFLSLKQIRP